MGWLGSLETWILQLMIDTQEATWFTRIIVHKLLRNICIIRVSKTDEFAHYVTDAH